MLRWPAVFVLALAGVFVAGSEEASAQAQFRGRARVSADAFTGSSETEPTLALEPRLRFRLSDGSSLSLMPAGWIDLSRDGRTVVDPVRFEWTKSWNEWDVLIGASETSWGVMESHRAVDIINQWLPTSSSETVTKLAQPMARVTVIQPWGTVSAYLLPGFRERPFVGQAGTLWTDIPVDDDHPILEHRNGLLPIDWAVRWSHGIGAFEFAVSHFAGRSREPVFTAGSANHSRPLRPTYELTNQTSLEAQWTAGRWLLKGEALTRTWRGDRIGGFAVGAEYVVADYLSLFVEYLADSRGSDAPSSFENDVFVGARAVFDGGSLTAGVFVDTDSGNRLGRVSVLRSLTDRLAVRLEATGFGGDSRAEPRHALRHETFLSVGLVAFF
jgi:hypothetical protein